jgi:hypothetical protein
MFNLSEMTKIAAAAISEFATAHLDETFYSFAIDANMLCMNSLEQFQKTLAYYQKKYPDDYSSDEDVRDLRENTGDWEYQGFFHLEEMHGFDDTLYDEHYELAGSSEEGRDMDTAYAKAMTELVAALIAQNAFKDLKLASDFTATWVDHNY